VKILLDTSVLLRLANINDVQHHITMSCISRLEGLDHELIVCAQTLIEFRSVATRPVSVNGLGMSSEACGEHIDEFASNFDFVQDSPQLFLYWKSTVSMLRILGKQVHDARIAAYCYANRLDAILTYNLAAFQRFKVVQPPLIILDPATV
jgi:predicted nucleic acid-binding protein